MDWIEQLNKSLQYIEAHLTTSIDLTKVAQIAQCSTYHYQRMFSYIAGVPLAEYIRRRKLTLAAFDLQKGDKVLDVALRYGYDSPTAFNRAFKSIHRMAPSEAKKPGANLVMFAPLTFQIKVEGVTSMQYHIEEKEAIRVIGFDLQLSRGMEESMTAVPQFWNQLQESGKINQLFPYIGEKINGVLGVTVAYSDEAESWNYLVAVASDQPLPKGMDEEAIPASKWAIFPGQGPMPGAIQELHSRIFKEWLPTSGYEYANLPDIEVYLDANPADASFEVWLPVIEKKSCE